MEENALGGRPIAIIGRLYVVPEKLELRPQELLPRYWPDTMHDTFDPLSDPLDDPFPEELR